MADLAAWLARHGLEQHAELLAANDIDLDILPELTDQDLAQLGLSLGHRRRLLKAVATLAGPAPVAPAATPSPTERTPADQAPAPEAERRQVTVLFCDLVGSTELANRIDPEDMGRLIRRYQDGCAGGIARFDGFLAKLMGDGVLAYFGFPQAHEDAAERAVRAGLAMIEVVGGIAGPDGRPLAPRIGIATGIVVVGDIVGSGVAREQSIVGETPNLAARLQALAEPGTVLVAESTRRLLGRLFEERSLGAHRLKGFAEPVPVWQVLREAPAASRFAAVRAQNLTPLVGRDHEMALLLDRWRLAADGEGQMVLLTGEAGIGKSRIVDALVERLAGMPHGELRLQASPHHVNSALYPVARALELAAGFAFDDPVATKLDKLEAMLAATATPSVTAPPLLAELLSLDPGDRYAKDDLTSAQRRAALIDLLVQRVIGRAERAPMLMLVEDAHWLDPTSIALITRMIDGIATARVLILVTARPDFISPWQGRAHATALALNRLGRSHCAAMVAGVAASRALPPSLVEAILARTDGVPLFVEELTRTLLEASPAERAAVPATLNDSLMARLDRLGPAKEIAQTAAVIGRQFSMALLAAVVPLGTDAIEAAVAKLVEADMVFPESRALERSYSFKHALTRDAAYGSLLRSRLEPLHLRIARALEERFPSIAETEPELVAHHYGHGGMPEPASRYWERAGERAAARSAYAEAVAHFEAGLDAAARLPDGEARDRHELSLYLKLGPALTVLNGPHHASVEACYAQAHAIGQRLGDGPELFKATWGLWLVANLGLTVQAVPRAEELVALGQRLDDEELLLEAIHCRWSTAIFHGDMGRALEDCRSGLERYDPERHARLAAIYGGHDVGVCAHSCRGIALALTGTVIEAQRAVDQAMALADSLQHPHSLAHALANAALTCQMVGDRPRSLRFAERLIAVAEKYDFPPQRGTGLAIVGWVQAQEDLLGGLTLMEAQLNNPRTFKALRPYFATFVAEARARAGQFAEALALLDEMLANARSGTILYGPEFHRLRAECLVALDRAAAGEALKAFDRAIAIAQAQGASVLALRAVIGRARLLASIGQAAAGRDALIAACAALPAGFDAPERHAARRVHEELKG